MKNGMNKIDAIDYMIARRRPKIKRPVWKNPLLKTSVSLAAITVVIGSGVLVCSMVLQNRQGALVKSCETTEKLSQQDTSAITRPIDDELFVLIEDYQNLNRLSPRRAVDTALYDMWQRFEREYKENPSEENNIILGHISKRGKQANRMLLSNTVGDKNPFLEQLYNELYEEKVSTSEVCIPQQTHSR